VSAAFSHDPTARDESSLIEENLLQQLRELIENLLCGGDRIDGDIVLEIDSNEKTLKILPQHSATATSTTTSSLVREDQEGNYYILLFSSARSFASFRLRSFIFARSNAVFYIIRVHFFRASLSLSRSPLYSFPHFSCVRS
jgi:hypothetical protein